ASVLAENALAAAHRKNLAVAPRQALGPQLATASAKVAACRKELAVDSGKYTPISPVYPSTSTGRRTALARWIASPDNPLTARVLVNRIWQQHFDRGLVSTPSDFGKNGEKPAQPELLDWLATVFVERVNGRTGERVKTASFSV